MIVEPDFLTHWKTQMLIAELNDKAAPLYVISLWAHCQLRKSDSFHNLAPSALKGICRYEGEASKLRSALERCGFIVVQGNAILVHGWSQVNAKLVANWKNGAKGGRPKEVPDKTQPEPNDNPTPNWDNPTVTDKRREDGLDKNKTPFPQKIAGEADNPSKSPRKEDDSPPDPRHSTIVKGWCEGYEKAYGRKYPLNGGKEGKHLKQFLERCKEPPEDIIAMASKAWERAKLPYSKFCKNAATLSGFCDHYAGIIAELAQPTTNGNQRRPLTTAADHSKGFFN